MVKLISPQFVKPFVKGNPTDYQGFLILLILPLPVSLPVGAWFVPES
jgi:hypothetical protein